MTEIALEKTSEILKRMKRYVKGILIIFVICLIIFVKPDQNLLELIATASFAVVATLLATGLTDTQITLQKKAEEIRNIEKSLESFYRPLQNLFHNTDDPIGVYQEKKEKYDEIGCYRHLAEPDTLRYFEKCPQTNENLKDLLKQIDKDISNLKSKYEQLKEV